MVVLIAPPAGEAYEFIVDLYTYPGAWINSLVGIGILYLHFNREAEGWTSPWNSPLLVNLFFLLSNLFLALVPFIPPTGPSTTSYPYYVFPVVGVAVLLFGLVYWVFWKIVLPKVGGYKVVVEREMLEGGDEIVRFKKIKTG